MSDFSLLKIKGLKLELKKYGLNISGNKKELIDRLNSFLKPKPFFRGDREENKEEKSSKKSSKGIVNNQTVNIYTDGLKVETDPTSKNIYISANRDNRPILPSGNNPSLSLPASFYNPTVVPVKKFPSVVTTKPVFLKPSEETKQEIITGIPRSIGEEDDDEEEVIKPLPKKLVLGKKFTDKLSKALSGQSKTTQSNLSESIPLPKDIVLPTPFSKNIPKPP